jgi:hypothetical protein
MKLIIDVPEQMYLNAKKDLLSGSDILVSGIKNGIPLEQIRAEIERLHHHPKLDFIKNDEVVEMALDIIDKYKESEGI